MRQVLLTLLTAFAVAASGFAAAAASVACPMQTPTHAEAQMHACCPGESQQQRNDGGDKSKGMADCSFMQLCRTAPATEPLAGASLAAPMTVVLTTSAPRFVEAALYAPLDGVFRPPRTI